MVIKRYSRTTNVFTARLGLQSPIPSPSYLITPSPPPAYTLPNPNTWMCETQGAKRRFCLTLCMPDARWIKVEVTGVDEVSTHFRVFFLRGVYVRLAGVSRERTKEQDS